MALKDKFQSKIGPMQQRVKGIVKEYGDTKISDVTVTQAYGGMRGVKCIVTETSALDPFEGIRFRGYNIPQLQEKLPNQNLESGLCWHRPRVVVESCGLPAWQSSSSTSARRHRCRKRPECGWKSLLT